MPALKGDALVKAVESLVAEKEAVAGKEKTLVAVLNSALGRMGYQVVAVDRGVPARRGSRQAGRISRRRKPMSTAARRAASRRMKAYWAKRRGRATKIKAKGRGRRQAEPAAS